jgi:hypothetical protein
MAYPFAPRGHGNKTGRCIMMRMMLKVKVPQETNPVIEKINTEIINLHQNQSHA